MTSRVQDRHRTIYARVLATATEWASEGTVVAFNVGPDESVIIVEALRDLDCRTEQPGWASFPKPVPQEPQDYRVVAIVDHRVTLDIRVAGERFNIHDVQPVGRDLLLLSARSHFRGPADFDRNGRLYSRDGSFIREIAFGDGIETIQATSNGAIWAAYFDEGIFGNFGWEDPLGASGLVAWDAAGCKRYEYDGAPISDCYALNVVGDDDVWVCYYTDFPIVHLHEQRVAGWWTSPVRGSHAFAVHGDHVLFAGSYDDRESLYMVALGAAGHGKVVARLSPVDGAGTPLSPDRVVGRGDSIYLMARQSVYRIRVQEALP